MQLFKNGGLVADVVAGPALLNGQTNQYVIEIDRMISIRPDDVGEVRFELRDLNGTRHIVILRFEHTNGGSYITFHFKPS
jgi:hypothetical protein